MNYKKIHFLLILFVSILFLENLQIYKKIFILISKNPDKRLIDQNGYCGGESVGFIKFLFRKYDFKDIPKIINNGRMVPDSYWSIFKFDKNVRENRFNYNYIILLNYNFPKKNKIISLEKKQIDLNNYNIIENYENCFLLKLI